jgi:site-specific recombinase XerD
LDASWQDAESYALAGLAPATLHLRERLAGLRRLVCAARARVAARGAAHPTMRALDRYLPARAAALAGRAATPALLVSPTRGARLTRQAAYGRIARLAHAPHVGRYRYGQRP